MTTDRQTTAGQGAAGQGAAGQGTERHDTVVIGAGQAGLSTGHHLARRGREFLILDANERIGDNWHAHWDSLRLYTPARYDGLPGMRFPAPGWSFPGKDAVGNYLATYAEHFRLPVRLSTRVRRLARDGAGYRLTTDRGDLLADNVVVATGTFGRTPKLPAFAPELASGIHQLHSTEYHGPYQLPTGPVLVVGASHSGADIAYETAKAGHPTVLCGRDTGKIPFPLEARASRAVLPLLWLVARHLLTVRTPLGRHARPEIREHGGPLLRVKPADLAAAGVERTTERMAGVRDGRPVLDGGRVLDVASVVWCTGLRQDFGWIDLPVFDPDGWPREREGVVADAPGLYFTGLAFQRAFSSMLIGGAGRDAEFVVRHLCAHRPAPDRDVPKSPDMRPHQRKLLGTR
ncbi:flavin-containing monooxygenase [Kitasatospora sp. NPDC048365]|uniref:flavin-containing monooxygenase n=1 Tax=Kitasatospora sp. NPDC048365 TaxID=3364050 RepID=UPI003714D4BD